MNNSPSISLCVITKNEEHCLARCLCSVQQLVTEIIVIDTGSTDTTAQIAENHGASVFFFPWVDDFAAARNYGLSKAQGDWILVLDADEALAPLPSTELWTFLECNPAEGYYFKICSYLEHTNGPAEDYVVRLFKNTPEYRFAGAIHEQIAGSIQNTAGSNALTFAPFTIHHYGYLLKERENKHKFSRNTSIIQKALLTNPQDPFLHYCLGIEYLQNKDFRQAGRLFQQTLPLLRGEEGYIPQVLLSLLLVKLTEPEDCQAEETFRNAMQTLPDNGDIFCLYGFWLLQHKRFTEAASILETTLLKQVTLLEHNRLTALLGDAYFLSGLLEQAAVCYSNALCAVPADLYALRRILTMWNSVGSSAFWEPLWKKLTPDITTALYIQTLAAGLFTFELATLLFSIIKRSSTVDIRSIVTDCAAYHQRLKSIPAASYPSGTYAILVLGAEEIVLQSQLLQLAGDHAHLVRQALLAVTMENLLLVAFLVQELYPSDPLPYWEEVFLGETRFNCQSR